MGFLLSVTLSIGVSQLTALEKRLESGPIARARRALYQGKERT